MIGILVKEAAGVVNRRLYLNAFLPAILSLGLAVTAVLAVRPGLAAAARDWAKQSPEIKTLQAVAFVAVAGLLAETLAGSGARILRFFEGYWALPGGRFAAAVGTRFHRHQLALLAERNAAGDLAAYELIYTRYPGADEPDEVMPTRLGNIIKNAELYPRERYDIDAVLIWPRLYPLLPDGFAAAFSASRAELDRNLTLTTMGCIVTPITSGYVLVAGGPWQQYLAWLIGGSVFTRLMYRSSLASAAVYGQHIKTAFDLYRQNLLAQVWPTPPADLEESALWARLAELWYLGIPLDAIRADAEPDQVAQAETAQSEAGPEGDERLRWSLSLLLAVGVAALAIIGPLLLRG